MIIVAEFDLLDTVAGSRVTIRACNTDDPQITTIGGEAWAPAITDSPTMSQFFFDGDFGTGVRTASASLSINLESIKVQSPAIARLLWQGAPVRIYAGTIDRDWPWRPVFIGRVTKFQAEGTRVDVDCKVDEEPFNKDILTLSYAGIGDAEGGPDLKNKVKPWLFGTCLNVEPVLISIVDNVYQVSAYGPVQAITGVFERGSAFPAAVADYPDYASLVAATIEPGQWASCLAEGMFRLGAPPYGVITADVEGYVSHGTLWQHTADVCMRAMENAGLTSEQIDLRTFSDLDASMKSWPNQGRIGIYLTSQETVLSLAQRLCLPCNAIVGIDWVGRIFAKKISIGSEAGLTLDAQGRRLPPVISSVESTVNPPYKRIEFSAVNCWRVHSFDEIAAYYTFVERGIYDGAKTYREGNIVDLADGSRWLYINNAATSGNSPPNSVYWEELAIKSYTGTTAANGALVANTIDNEISDPRWTDGVMGVWYQAQQPTGANDGDLWFDSGDDTQHVYSGGGWQVENQPQFGLALREIIGDILQSTGQALIYANENQPVAESNAVAGYVWYRPSTRSFERFDGTQFSAPPFSGSALDFNVVDGTGNNVVDADVLNWQRRRLVYETPVYFDFDASNILQTPLPLTISVDAMVGNTDVSGVTDFAATFAPSVAGTINNTPADANRGDITITGYSAPGVITVTATFEDGLKESVAISLLSRLPGASESGGTGATMVKDTNWLNVDSATYAVVTDIPMTLDSDGSGNLKFKFISSFSAVAGGVNIRAQASYRASGSSDPWVVVSGEVDGLPTQDEPELPFIIPGFIELSEVTEDTGTPNATWDVQLEAKIISGSGTVVFDSSSSLFQAKQ